MARKKRGPRGRDRVTLLNNEETGHVTGLESPFEIYWNGGEQFETELLSTRYMTSFYTGKNPNDGTSGQPNWAGYQQYLEGLFGKYDLSYSQKVWEQELKQAKRYQAKFLDFFNVSNEDELLKKIDAVLSEVKDISAYFRSYSQTKYGLYGDATEGGIWQKVYGLLHQEHRSLASQIRNINLEKITEDMLGKDYISAALIDKYQDVLVDGYLNHEQLRDTFTTLNLNFTPGLQGAKGVITYNPTNKLGRHSQSLKTRQGSGPEKDEFTLLEDVKVTRKERLEAKGIFDLLKQLGVVVPGALSTESHEELYGTETLTLSVTVGDEVITLTTKLNQDMPTAGNEVRELIDKYKNRPDIQQAVRIEIIKRFALNVQAQFGGTQGKYIYKIIMAMAKTPNGADAFFIGSNELNVAGRLGEIIGAYIFARLLNHGEVASTSDERIQGELAYNATQKVGGRDPSSDLLVHLVDASEGKLGIQIKNYKNPKLIMKTTLHELIQKVPEASAQIPAAERSFAYYYGSKAFYNATMGANIKFINNLNNFLMSAISLVYKMQTDANMSGQGNIAFLMGDQLVFTVQMLEAINTAFKEAKYCDASGAITIDSLNQNIDTSGLIVQKKEGLEIDTLGFNLKDTEAVLNRVKVRSTFDLSAIIAANVNSWTRK